MKFFTNLFKNTLLFKFYNVFYTLVQYIKDYNYLCDFIYSNTFFNLLEKYLKINPRKDWLGRIYGIMNPNIDINGKFDVTSMIIELDGENTNNYEQVKNWIYKQLMLVSQLFKINNLWNYMSLSFRQVGPINADNYLLVFDIASRQLFAKAFKQFMLHLFIYIIIAIIIIVLL